MVEVMKNKKIYSILIIASLVCISVSATAIAGPFLKPISPVSQTIEDTGTVFRDKSNLKGPYLIKGDKGYDYRGRHYDTYYPLNLNPDFKKEGLRVGFIAKTTPFMSVRSMIIIMLYNALPIVIKDIWRLDQPRNGSIAGYVLEEDEELEGHPIVNTKVTATLLTRYSTQEPIVYEAYTDEYGAYKIKDVIPGKYEMVASHEGYESQTKQAEVKPGQETSVDFRLKKINEELKLVACFEYEPKEPIVNKEITFGASCSNDPDGEIVDYKWTIKTETDKEKELPHKKIVTVIPPLAGTYIVELTVTDNDGLTDSITQEVIVKEK